MNWSKLKSEAKQIWNSETAEKARQWVVIAWEKVVFDREQFSEAGRGRKIWLITKAAIALVILFFIALEMNLFWLFGDMPTMREARNPKLPVPSKVFTEEGETLGQFYVENRSPVPFDQIDSLAVDALIATEDVRFYRHHGLDLMAFPGMILSTASGDTRGGSTINQQVVKNIYKTRRAKSQGLLGYVPVVRTLIAKLKEWDVALKMDFFFTKEEILALYLNAVDFGDSTYGIKLASQHFFSKGPQDLELHEAALLIGILKGTNFYSPKRQPERALERRNVVLSQMLRYDKITEEEYIIITH